MTCSHSPSRRPNLVHFKPEMKGGVNGNDFSYFRAFFAISSFCNFSYRFCFEGRPTLFRDLSFLIIVSSLASHF